MNSGRNRFDAEAVAICAPCLRGLVRQTAELATEDPELRKRAVDLGDALIADRFRPGVIPAQVATLFSREIKAITSNPDPFRKQKDTELALALRAIRRIELPEKTGPLVSIAARGNAVDYFRDPEASAADLLDPRPFAIDHTDLFERRLEEIRTGGDELVYLADNGAEVVFDLPLLKHLHRSSVAVTLVVKGGGVQTDCTLEDLHIAHPEPLPFEVMDNGTDAVGTDPGEISHECRDRIERAGLLVAKGMANYETFLDLPTPPTLFLMMAKCPVVAGQMEVDQGAMVAWFRR